MRKIYKITAFLLIVAIALNVNIGLDGKHFVRLGMREVGADNTWELVHGYYINIGYGFEPTTRYWTYDDEYTYKIVLTCSNTREEGTLSMYVRVEDNTTGSTIIRSEDLYHSGRGNTSKSIYLNDDVYNLIHSHVYINSYEMSINGALGNLSYELYRQLKNGNPTLTLTQPTANSPLQGRQAHEKGAA